MKPRVYGSDSAQYTRYLECDHLEILKQIHNKYTFHSEKHLELTSEDSLLKHWFGALEVAIQDKISKNIYLPAFIHKYSTTEEDHRCTYIFEYKTGEIKESTSNYIDTEVLAFYNRAFLGLFDGYSPTFWAFRPRKNTSAM